MDPIRWGVIGLGRFGRIHAKVLSSLRTAELRAVCTRNPDRLEQARREFPSATATSDYQQLLADPAIDAVSITTHWKQHAAIASDALLVGKHVLLEKPMAAGSEECLHLLQIAQRTPSLFMVGHVCRFDPRVTLAKKAIDEGRLGRLVSIHAKRNLPKAPGSLRLDKISPLLGDGVHDADLILWFMGRLPNRVLGKQIRVHDYAYPDVGWALLDFPAPEGDPKGAALGVIETNWALPENTPTVIDAQMQIIGSEGQLTIDCSQTGLQLTSPEGHTSIDTDYWPEQHDRQVGALAYELDYFCECISAGRPPSVITPVEAARAVMLMERAEESASQDRPLPFDPPV